MDTLTKVQEMLASQLNLSVDTITEDKEIVKDLGADSLDVVEMLMNLEETYSVSIPDEDAMSIKTVGDVVKVIEGLQK
ncbi:MAG: acyl carrier protein [Clostridia bacterium]|nr:acyl carrier protein [Clostridia bacterium]